DHVFSFQEQKKMPRRSSAKNHALLSCATSEQLLLWIRKNLNLNIPTQPICPNHNAPFEYLQLAYHEPAADLVVWAPRGGGKTRLAAIATLLDLLHKPGCSIAILGGSLLQS